MLVEYDVIHVPKTGERSWEKQSTEYRGAQPKDFCCNSMRVAYGRMVKFGSFADYKHDASELVMGVMWQYDGDAFYDDYSIFYCPFCGEKIETRERAEYDRTYHERMEPKAVTYFEDVCREKKG